MVREEQVLADLVDLHASDRFARDLPASLLYITGPSKTADIEGVLITGVHGPGEVHVLLVGAEAVVGVSRRDAEPRNGRPPLHSP
jgi:L-lactate utilization protein LutC